MRWAVKTAKGRHVPHDTREEAEESRQRYIECDVRFADSTVVRVLSHEEAKRKAAALELLRAARWARKRIEECNVYRAEERTKEAEQTALYLEAEAEKLWPALFHAGDGRKPRGKR